jgi:hypothetical protein
MALPRRYQQTSLILIESHGAYFQLMELCTQDEVKRRFWGSRGVAVHRLVLEWAAKVGHCEMLSKQFQNVSNETGAMFRRIGTMICMAK